jgi:hypothetical protein
MTISAPWMLLIAAGSCCLSEAASSADRDPLDAKFIVDIGAFLMSTDTRVRVDGETTGSRGTDVDYDDTFGLHDSDRFRAEAFWRIGERHAIRGMYFKSDRSATRRISREINFGDQTFPLGASVTAGSDLTIAQLSYDYAFLRRDAYELAGSAGLHVMDLGLNLSATITGNNGSVSRVIAEDASTTAPLPVVGLCGVWRLPHNFYLGAQAQYFYISLDPYSGSLADLKADLVWQATDHFGIGVGYNDFRFRFDIEDNGKFNGRLRWNYGGALVFASFMF